MTKSIPESITNSNTDSIVSCIGRNRLLADLAFHIEYLQLTGKNLGNQLERTVYVKLQDPLELTLLRADGLMYYHIYADLVMLSKSTHLGKSALDMNQHYLELLVFLQEVKSHPEVVLDNKSRVFVSEERLYGNDKKINHRLHPRSQAIYKNLFVMNESESTTLYPVLVAGGKVGFIRKESTSRRQVLGS